AEMPITKARSHETPLPPPTSLALPLPLSSSLVRIHRCSKVEEPPPAVAMADLANLEKMGRELMCPIWYQMPLLYQALVLPYCSHAFD
ncbi:hypothetical protein BHE74_00043008, partial [Ensete ventricosum]